MNRHAVLESFNRIALHATESWNHNNQYYGYLLRYLPEIRGAALDVGSGLGEFSRLLSGHFAHVEGIDFSPEMVELAIARSAAYTTSDTAVRIF